ncbi:hypothetical protein [Adhaeribacter arboris]|nr:hypothetical protein [Adhaeribacter arboris]
MLLSSTLKTALLIIASAWLLISCNKAQGLNSAPAKLKNPTAAVKNRITFKVNGIPVKTSGWTVSRFKWQAGDAVTWLNITTNMHEEKRTLNVNLNGSAPADYTFQEGGSFRQKSHGSYKPDYLGDLLNSYSLVAGTFHLTQVDTINQVVNGTFKCQVKNTAGETLFITEGQIINATLSRGITKY